MTDIVLYKKNALFVVHDLKALLTQEPWLACHDVPEIIRYLEAVLKYIKKGTINLAFSLLPEIIYRLNAVAFAIQAHGRQDLHKRLSEAAGRMNDARIPQNCPYF